MRWNIFLIYIIFNKVEIGLSRRTLFTLDFKVTI